MNNSLICLEGNVSFEEEVNVQSLDLIKFKSGQQISVSRERFSEDRNFHDHISQQLSNANNFFSQFNLVRMEKFTDSNAFSEAFHIIYTFSAGTAPEKRAWQVTYACLLKDKIINFTSVYPDEESMNKESGRLHHCVKNFSLHSL